MFAPGVVALVSISNSDAIGEIDLLSNGCKKARLILIERSTAKCCDGLRGKVMMAQGAMQ